jgi:PPM family protein phosphatase
MHQNIDIIQLQPAPNLAGASDRGRRHHQNEDAIALQIIDTQASILVVCDGVSSSQQPELASQSAATDCIQAIEPDAAMIQGVEQASISVSNVPFDPYLPEDYKLTRCRCDAVIRSSLQPLHRRYIARSGF